MFVGDFYADKSILEGSADIHQGAEAELARYPSIRTSWYLLPAVLQNRIQQMMVAEYRKYLQQSCLKR